MEKKAVKEQQLKRNGVEGRMGEPLNDVIKATFILGV